MKEEMSASTKATESTVSCRKNCRIFFIVVSPLVSAQSAAGNTSIIQRVFAGGNGRREKSFARDGCLPLTEFPAIIVDERGECS